MSIAPFLNDCSSAACVSADFEMSWAFRALPPAECEQRARRERNNIPWLVEALERLDVPVTWATVGHLLLDECASQSGRAHADMPRPPRDVFWAGDWYKHDPCSNVQREPLWYAPDLIALIRSAHAGHEIGSQSFSHIDYSPGNSSSELVRRELEEFQRCLQRFGVLARSHVFPFNRIGAEHLPVLAAGGITAVRWRDPCVRVSYPIVADAGVYRMVESLSLRRPRFCRLADLAETLLDHADRRQAAFHFWFHPSEERALLEDELLSVLCLLRDRHDRGRTWLTTMGSLAAYCEAREKAQISVQRTAQTLAVSLSSQFDAARYGVTDLTLTVQESVQSATMITSRDREPRPTVPFDARGATCVNVPYDTLRVNLSMA